MTATTNGASLEDCLTNIFSLIDLNGIRWKRFKNKDNHNHNSTATNTSPPPANTSGSNNNTTTNNNNNPQHNPHTPIDTHPILTTYAKCIEENHIAVWRHEPQRRQTGGQQSANQNQQGAHSNFPTPTRTSNNNTPTSAGPNHSTVGQASQANNNTTSSASSSNNQNNLELWIFGYGNQLKVDNIINGDELVEIEDETWESKGLSYECRILLFKALHNLIERCLITKGFTKLGRWFVQPHSENLGSNHHQQSPTSASNAACSTYATNFDKPMKYLKLEHNSITATTSSPGSLLATATNQSNKSNLSSTISSTINRIIECRKKLFDSKQSLDKTDGLRHTSLRSSSTYFTTTLDGFKSSLSFAFSFFVHGDSTICATVDVRQQPLVHPLTRADLNAFQEGAIVRVALAPYGLNGILNGVSYKDSDNGAATTTFIQQWSKFYPLPKTLARLVPSNKSSNNNGAIATNLDHKTSNQYTNSPQNLNSSRSYLSNLTNMLLPPTHQKPFLHFNHEPNEVPPIVEVIVAGYRMRYPSECVFTTSKIVDIYKSLSSPSNRSNPANIKKPNKSTPNKPNKPYEKSGDDKTDSQQLTARVKVEQEQVKNNVFNSPFKLSTNSSSGDGNKLPVPISDNLQNNSVLKQTTANAEKDKNGSDSQNITMSRYNSSKVGFGANTMTSLGPFDISKIYPTPPSLEQIILSPSNNTEENPKELTTTLELAKDNGIDVYKPVECALMPPPPKWAALTNIIISSSKSLPPECVYKCSTQNNSNSKTVVNKLTESAKGNKLNFNLIKRYDSNPAKNNIHQSIASPLTDQTNKNGFNLNVSSPRTPISSLAANSPSVTSSNFNMISSGASILTACNTITTTTTTTTTFSSFTLPHQRIFNNLHEINSIQLNLLISDSVIAMFKDHNFESCTLCVCNMSIKGTQNDTVPQRNENTSLSNSTHWRQSIGSDSLLGSSTPSGEYINECTCGFSAVTNRHSSHLSGLFLEDELEITNVLYDPTEMIDQNKLYRKLRLSNYSETSYNDEQKLITKLIQESESSAIENSEENCKTTLKSTPEKSKDDKSSQASHSLEETKVFVIDQLKQQCSSTIHSNSSLSKILLIESFRNNRHLMSCSNYYAQTTINNSNNTNSNPIYRYLDDKNKHITVKIMNRNSTSLRFSDSCEFVKGIITKMGNQMNTSNVRSSNSLVKPIGGGPTPSGLIATISRIFGANRHSSILAKSGETNNRNNIFIQGLKALVMPTITLDPKGALQMLEYLLKEDSKEALVTLNKAILIFTSPMHDWQFLGAPIPENNFDVANLLKILQPSLEESIGSHNKLYKDYVHQQQQHIFSARDSPTGAPTLPTPPCQGPLTWRQFHSASGRGTEDQCEPQPIPSLLIGHHVEKNHLAVSPFALKFWDKLLLEPYVPGHNMFYVVLAPDYQNILSYINQFFKELSNTFELMKLGKHIPINNGLVLANFTNTNSSEENQDDWFAKANYHGKDPSNLILSRLRRYASKMNSTLAKTITDFMDERQPPYDPHADRFDSSPAPQTNSTISNSATTAKHPQTSSVNQSNRPFNNPLGLNVSSNPTSTNPGQTSDISSQLGDNQSSVDLMNNPGKSQSLIGSSGGHNTVEDTVHQDDEINKQSGIVIYIIDPFSSPSINQNLRALAIIGLFKCYSMLLDQLPENIRRITQVQLISLDSIISHSRPIFNISRVDQLKSLSMNVFSRCKKILTNQATAKSLTGFGPAAALETFFKTKNGDLCLTKMFSPPFILAPMKDKQTELGEMFGDRREKSSVLFCSYCITEDQRWLIASVTNDKGEMSETTVININIIERIKRPKASVRRIALRKLMDFIISVMSDWMNPWRLIIGKLGRVGHGELKEWATLMSKRSLLNYSRHLTERCRQCTILPSTETVSILSACLVSLEPDSKLRIMPDQFTSDDRQASFNKCPLNTPEDATATHILVFPTSASIQSSHGIVEDPLAGSGLDDDLLNQFPLEDGIEDLGVEENMDDLFSAWDDNQNNVNDHINPHHDTMMSSNNLQMGSGSVGDNANNQDETLQLLQQPLALGYYISTAKIGQMPNWFWSTSPHLRNSCPLFLKSALHIHMPCVQLSDDLLHSGVGQPRKSHQLDSNLTTDVLRYVLEGYNSLSWLSLNPRTYDRQSCLPVHMQNLLQLYHLMESLS